MQTFKSIEYLFENICGLILRESLSVIQIGLNVTSVAKLRYYENVAWRLERINMSDYVFIMARFKDFYLGLDKLLKFSFFLDQLYGNGFNSNPHFSCPLSGLINDSV
jgi:hypothetical protein